MVAISLFNQAFTVSIAYCCTEVCLLCMYFSYYYIAMRILIANTPNSYMIAIASVMFQKSSYVAKHPLLMNNNKSDQAYTIRRVIHL